MPLKIFFLSLPVILSVLTLSAQKSDSIKILNPGISYTGDLVRNISGGIKPGSAYLGMVNVRLEINTWKRGRIYINAANTHGAEPSLTLTGDQQVFSNIEAGDHTYLQELWFRQSWEKGEITFGLQDLNIDFANLSGSGFYLNSSFGILPTVSSNVPAPIFPLTSLGLSAKWHITPRATLLVAAFDGEPTNFEDNPHNLKWDLKKKDGFLFFGELQKRFDGRLPACIKAGFYGHRHFFDDEYDLIDTNSLHLNNYGFYLLGENDIWHEPDGNRVLAAFVQTGLSPKKINQHVFYAGLGLNFYGLLNRNGDDVAGIAVAHDITRRPAGDETAIELSYRFPVFSAFFIQPDLQYIINPAGTGIKHDNAFVFVFRFGVALP